MGFQWAPGLWFALTLPAIVLLYLLKRKYMDTPVSSHMLWSRVYKDLEASSPWQRLRSRLLMFLQLLAAMLGVLALAGFFLWRGSGTSAHIIYVLDGSASMSASAGAASGDGSSQGALKRFDQAKQAIRDHASHKGRQGEWSLLLLSREPVVLLSRGSALPELEAALHKAQLDYGQAAYRETLSLAAAMGREDGNAKIVLATDGLWLEQEEQRDIGMPLDILPLEPAGDSSAGILRFGVASAPSTEPEGAEAQVLYNAVATVKNWGSGAVEAQASVYAGNKLAVVDKTVLAPGEEKQFSFRGLPVADWYRLSLSAVPDGFLADNEAYAFPAAGRLKTAVLAGADNLFLEKALQLAGLNVIKSQKAISGGYALPRSEPDLVVLSGIPETELSSDGWKRLLGQKPVWAIGVRTDAAEVEAAGTDAPVVKEHPVMKYVSWDQVHVSKAYRLTDPEGLASLVTKSGLPLVLESNEGSRRLEFAFRLENSDLALRPDFPILAQNAVNWLTELTGGVLGAGLAGQPLELSLAPGAEQAVWEREDGAGLFRAYSEAAAAGALSAAPGEPGLYRLVEKDQAGAVVRQRYYAVSADVREADLRPGNGKLPPASGLESAPAAGPESDPPYNLAPWLIAACIAVLLVEWEVYRRGNTI